MRPDWVKERKSEDAEPLEKPLSAALSGFFGGERTETEP